jgi:glutamine synthetase
VWCDILLPDQKELDSSREKAVVICEKHRDKEPWFAFEQEYTLLNKSGVPLAFTEAKNLPPQGPYYCGIGVGRAFGRNIAEEHYSACLYAGLDISGINAEVMPGQWEFQIGHAIGADVGDQLMISRYILDRICEKHNIIASLDPKPDKDWNGAGCHANFSTSEMRTSGGCDHILEAMTKLEEKHMDHINDYGDGNERRLTGDCETAPIDRFSYGVADRTASVRIPLVTSQMGYGYLEDRRPASNCDPYKVIWRLMSTIYGE